MSNGCELIMEDKNRPSTPSSKTLEERVDVLEKRLNNLLVLLRRAKMQNVRAKEKTIDRLKQEPAISDVISELLDVYLGESRRSDLQIVSFASKETGLRDRKSGKRKKYNKLHNANKKNVS